MRQTDIGENISRELPADNTLQPDVSKRMYASIVNGGQPSQDGQDQDLPSWQRSAPKAALYVNKGDAGAGNGSDKEPYPKKFEEILAFLQTGKEIPGIVQIPDTVIEDAVSENCKTSSRITWHVVLTN